MPETCDMSNPDGTVVCRLGEDGIEVFVSSERCFSMPWPWIDQVRSKVTKEIARDFEIPETQYGEWPEVERPQAEHGLKGYTKF